MASKFSYIGQPYCEGYLNLSLREWMLPAIFFFLKGWCQIICPRVTYKLNIQINKLIEAFGSLTTSRLIIKTGSWENTCLSRAHPSGLLSLMRCDIRLSTTFQGWCHILYILAPLSPPGITCFTSEMCILITVVRCFYHDDKWPLLHLAWSLVV